MFINHLKRTFLVSTVSIIGILHAQEPLKVTFFNVGQGNCVVVSCKNEPTMLVDAGSSQLPHDHSGNRIDAQTIKKIVDTIKNETSNRKLVVIVSHPDKDHVNWIPNIVTSCLAENYTITALLGGTKNDYLSKVTFKENFENLANAFTKKKLIFKYAADITNMATFSQKNLPSYCSILASSSTARNPNDRSIVVRVTDGTFSALLPGDATHKITDKLKANAASTVYMASHHGASSESCTNLHLLNKIAPSLIVVSNGMYGSYHHIPAQSLSIMRNYFKKTQHQWHPHTINFYSTVPKITDEEQEEQPKLYKPIIRYEKNWSTALTTYPILSTVNSGTMNVNYENDAYCMGSEYEQDPAISPKKAALQAIGRQYFSNFSFDTISQLNLSNLKLEDTDIEGALQKLPISLELCDLSRNSLSMASVRHCAALLEQRNKKTEIKFQIPYAPDTQNPLRITKIEKKEAVTEKTLKQLQRLNKNAQYATEALITKP